MSCFRKNITMHSFDLSDSMEPACRERISRYMQMLYSLYCQKEIDPIKPVRSFHVTNFREALRSFAHRPDGGKIVINYGLIHGHKLVKAKIRTPALRLDGTASYLMIGCLGGLGRSISMMMADKGARSLIFLSRTGDNSPEASELIGDLRAMRVEVKIIVGDVANRSDVRAAAQGSRFPVKGVVHAAMVLNDMLLCNMSLQHFTDTILAKVKGTENLHSVLLETKTTLDFFLLLSSVSGYTGQTAQANYAAANTFLDSFARYRQTLGLPATALALGIIEEVGYVSEHEEVARWLIQTGITTTDENEFLYFIEKALSPPRPRDGGSERYQDRYATSTILTGIEPTKPQKSGSPSCKTGKTASTVPADFRHGFRRLNVYPRQTRVPLKTTAKLSILHPTLKNILLSGDRGQFSVVAEAVRVQLGALLLCEPTELESDRAIAHYGMDSLVAAEFRNWLLGNFAVAIGLLELLEASCTIPALVETLAGRVKRT